MEIFKGEKYKISPNPYTYKAKRQMTKPIITIETVCQLFYSNRKLKC